MDSLVRCDPQRQLADREGTCFPQLGQSQKDPVDDESAIGAPVWRRPPPKGGGPASLAEAYQTLR